MADASADAGAHPGGARSDRARFDGADLSRARFTDTDITGARFTRADLSGSSLHDCDLRKVRISSSWLSDVSLSGVIDNLVVNDVDVTAYVSEELDRRHPERVHVRQAHSADEHRAAWLMIERLWAETVARAEGLPDLVHTRVDDEWSFAETLRHLVFATDLWAGHMILGLPRPFHPTGLPPTDHPRDETAALGVDLDARPSFAETLAVRAERHALVRDYIDELTDEMLEHTTSRLLPWSWAKSEPTVRTCLGVIMNEEVEHRRFAERDLTRLEAGRPSPSCPSAD
ncbi:DinB family protein [Nonomuraea soli]|uniref:DinB-like domain-containing protein n=1 Tax=Nonomuraea soli TaxID=1032476 RepID=A0A7W0CT22_9ACTN|nr:DinB family protein [Nonomuraea soli]MBA2896824.1 hypothetical protein [Nonomuraea soli]